MSRVDVEVETRSTFMLTTHYRNWGLFPYNMPGRCQICIGKRPYSSGWRALLKNVSLDSIYTRKNLRTCARKNGITRQWKSTLKEGLSLWILEQFVAKQELHRPYRPSPSPILTTGCGLSKACMRSSSWFCHFQPLPANVNFLLTWFTELAVLC